MPDITTGEEKQKVEVHESHEDPVHAAVAAAYEKAEKEAPTTPAPPTLAAQPQSGAAKVPPEGAAAAPSSVPGRDPATGKFVKPSERPQPAKPAAAAKGQAQAGKAPAPAAPAAPLEAKEKEEGEEPEAEPQDAKMVDRPPQSWRAGAKVLWGKLPPEVKAEVSRRERELEGVQRDAAGARRVADTFAEVVRPYEGFIRAAGHTPMQSVAELLKTAAALRTLPPWDRAVLVASIAAAHEVSPEYLFAALSGEGPASAPVQPAQLQDPRVDDLLAHLEERAEQVEAAADARADAELDTFLEANPLADDPTVMRRMAAFSDVAREEEGVDLSFEEAYSRVLAMDPELRAIVEQQREAQAAAANPEGSTQRSEAAASSVRPSPVPRAPAPLPRGLPVEDAVRAAVEKLQGRA